MNKEKQLEQAINNPDFLVLSGSRLYGTQRNQSDWDYRGFVIPPFPYLIGLAPFNDADLEGDHKVYSLRRYLELVLKGAPHETELLFAPKNNIKNMGEVGEAIISLRDKMVSQAIYHRLTGFAYSEWRKAMAQKLVIEGRTPNEDEVIDHIRNIFRPEKDDMDTILDILMKQKPRKLVDSTRKLGEKRKKEVEQYGYGVSSAAHAIRLVQQLEELLMTGLITFPRPNADWLRSIRQGNVSKDDVEQVYFESLDRAKEAFATTKLPKKPQRNFVFDQYEKFVTTLVKLYSSGTEFEKAKRIAAQELLD